MKLVFYLIPNGRLLQATFYQFSQSGAMCHTIDTRPHRHIVKYAASRQDIRLLEDHADMLSHMPWLDGPGVNVEAINQHGTLHTSIWHLLMRSEEHTSELQSPCNLVCRLLLEKKKRIILCTDLPHHH